MRFPLLCFLACVWLSAADDPYCQVAGRRKVLVIGVDGTKSTAFTVALEGGMAPNFASLVDRGKAAMCFNTTDPGCASAHSGNRFGSQFPRNDSDYIWVTTPGWTSVLSGVDNYKHRVKSNDPDTQAEYARTSKEFPTFMKRAQRMGLRTAAAGAPNFISGGPVDKIDGNWGAIDFECGMGHGPNGGPVFPNASSSCNLDYREGQDPDDPDRDAKTTAFGVSHIFDSSNPNEGCADVVMTHFDLIDHAGHSCTFGPNACYLGNISIVDAHVGDLLHAVNLAVNQRAESWLVLVTADHGGHNKSHDTKWFDDEVVPFIAAVFSPNQIPLVDLVYPVRHFDVAPTVMAWLGQSTAGQGLDGRVQAVPWTSRARPKPANTRSRPLAPEPAHRRGTRARLQ